MAYGKAGRPPKEGWLTIQQAADALGISYYRMREAIATGDAPALKCGRSYQISIKEVQYAKEYGRWRADNAKEKAEYPEGIPTKRLRPLQVSDN